MHGVTIGKMMLRVASAELANDAPNACGLRRHILSCGSLPSSHESLVPFYRSDEEGDELYFAPAVIRYDLESRDWRRIETPPCPHPASVHLFSLKGKMRIMLSHGAHKQAIFMVKSSF